MSSFPPKQKHLPTNRRRGSPQHSGRTPRLGFASAILTPPARNGCKNSGARPLASWFTIAVMACRKVKDSAFKHCCRRNAEQTGSRTRRERGKGCFDELRGKR